MDIATEKKGTCELQVTVASARECSCRAAIPCNAEVEFPDYDGVTDKWMAMFTVEDVGKLIKFLGLNRMHSSKHAFLC